MKRIYLEYLGAITVSFNSLETFVPYEKSSSRVTGKQLYDL